jgi:SAM-dependent methyltransferase
MIRLGSVAAALGMGSAGLTALVQEPIVTAAQDEPIKRDVPYVPTPQPVVDEMLKLAQVKKEDVVYDLGCGDGRIVVTAAKQYGARGVGVDIDPERIKESKENAEKAGVTDKVKFIQGDLFNVDLKEATVVTLYLLPNINLKLRPKLFRELKPGTRVVSHAFSMGDWKPEKVIQIPADGRDRTIYFWTIPAKTE